jgi:hypothetical protein
MPQRCRACGACSRELPQPKLRFTRSTFAALVLQLVEGVGGIAPVVREDVRFEPLERDRFQVTRGDDPVGVDVVPAQGNGAARDVRQSG